MERFTLNNLPDGHFCTYGHHDYRNGKSYEPHDHDFHEFFWVEAGAGYHWINGQRLTLKPGDLVLIRAPDAHSFSALSEGGHLQIVNFAFLGTIWRDFRRRYFDRATIFFSEPVLSKRSYFLNSSQRHQLHEAATQMRAGQRDRLQVESFLLAVLALLKADRFNSLLGSAPEWMRKVCSDIAQDRNFAGGIPALVSLAARSPEHVAREFQRYLGRTPTDIINDARMAYAAERLSTTEETIVAISLDCGLTNLSHFYRLFHARYGFTPRSYRLHQQRIGAPLPVARRPTSHETVHKRLRSHSLVP